MILRRNKPAKQSSLITEDDLNLDLGIESLESRQLLAGNVTATLVGGGNLVLVGDSDSNAVEVSINNATGDFMVTGLMGTTIDNSQILELDDAKISGDVKIDLKEGDNTLTVVGTGTYPGYESRLVDNISVKTGNGTDDVSLSNISFDGNLVVSSKGGNDVFNLQDLETNKRGSVKVSSTSGDNEITMEDVQAFYGKVQVKTGNGNDTIDTSYSTYGKYNFSVNSGGGNDNLTIGGGSFKSFNIVSGSGDDTLDVHLDSGGGRTKVSTGSGNDVVFVSGDTDTLQVSTSGGNDTLYMGVDVFGKTKISMGGGNDAATIGGSYFERGANIVMGGGDDTLNLTNLSGSVRASGGGAFDTLTITGTNEDISHSSFEIAPVS